MFFPFVALVVFSAHSIMYKDETAVPLRTPGQTKRTVYLERRGVGRVRTDFCAIYCACFLVSWKTEGGREGGRERGGYCSAVWYLTC